MINCRKVPVKLVMLAGLVLFISGCNFGLASPKITEIIEITQETKEEETIIYLRGIVNQVAPFLGGAAYQIKDNSGSIWVLTSETLPAQGEQVFIKGKVEYKSIPIAQQELGEFYIVEQEKIDKKTTENTEINEQKPTSKPDDLFFPHKQKR